MPIPITRPADALLAYSVLMVFAITPLVMAVSRNVELHRRILLTVGFQMGSVLIAAFMFMRYSPAEYRQDIGAISTIGGFLAFAYYAVIGITCASPFITFFLVRDAKRHPMHYFRMSDGERRLMPESASTHTRPRKTG